MQEQHKDLKLRRSDADTVNEIDRECKSSQDMAIGVFDTLNSSINLVTRLVEKMSSRVDAVEEDQRALKVEHEKLSSELSLMRSEVKTIDEKIDAGFESLKIAIGLESRWKKAQGKLAVSMVVVIFLSVMWTFTNDPKYYLTKIIQASTPVKIKETN